MTPRVKEGWKEEEEQMGRGKFCVDLFFGRASCATQIPFLHPPPFFRFFSGPIFPSSPEWVVSPFSSGGEERGGEGIPR